MSQGPPRHPDLLAANRHLMCEKCAVVGIGCEDVDMGHRLREIESHGSGRKDSRNLVPMQ